MQPNLELLSSLNGIRSALPWIVSIPAIVAGVYYIMLAVVSARRERASVDAWGKR